MKALTIILTLIYISINLTGCTANKERQSVDNQLQENKTQAQLPNGNIRLLLGSLTDDKLVPIYVPIDSVSMRFCHWSPDGQWLVYGNQGDLFIYNNKTGENINLTNTPDKWELLPFWSPDGSKLGFTSRPLDPREGRPSIDDDWVMSGPGGGSPAIICLDGTGYKILDEKLVINPLSWSPDGKTVAYGAGDSIHLYSLKDNKSILISPAEIGIEAKFIGSPSWSPKRFEIAFFFSLDDKESTREEILDGTASPTKQGFALLDLKTNEVNVLYTFEGLFTWCRPPALWNADGSKLAFLLRAEGLINNPTGLMVTNREGGNVHKIGEAYQALWEPNGNRLAYIDSFECHVVKIVSFDGDVYTTKMIEHENTFNDGITWQPSIKINN